MRGVCAHGSPTVATTGIAVRHDYAVSADTERAQVCNTRHARHTRAPVEPARDGAARLTHPPIPRTTPPDRQALTDTHPCLRCPDTPQSRRGTRPISSRSATDLGAEPDRSRAGRGPVPEPAALRPIRSSSPSPALEICTHMYMDARPNLVDHLFCRNKATPNQGSALGASTYVLIKVYRRCSSPVYC